MPDLGNAWHLPEQADVRGHASMREPVGAIVAGAAVTIWSGNQYAGDGGNPGNQLQDGSAVFFRRTGDARWRSVPLAFQVQTDRNKYYAATIPANTFAVGETVEYYLRIAYDDHATTFLQAAGTVSAVTGDEDAARSSPFSFVVEDSAVRGLWEPVFALPNVAIHVHVLPNGLLLMWGRRDRPDQSPDVHECTPFLWDPVARALGPAQPTLPVNLFCSGHAFMPDGRLLVAGGHWTDGVGLDQAIVYDPSGDAWTPTAPMNHGRWYPTATALPDGRALVLSGSYQDAHGATVNNFWPQIWDDGAWESAAPFPAALELYPRSHVASDGSVFMSGPLAQSWSLDVSPGGSWTPAATRINGRRDYAPAALYDVDKVVYMGGGNDGDGQPPTAAVETIDLADADPSWEPTDPMQFRRRQHNATLLPDGTVLVTGGTSGPGFNDLGVGAPVHVAELWNPADGHWTQMAAEQVDRCYHSTAVLLPDATVLSAGGGEFYLVEGSVPNEPQDSHRDAQIFRPPYLFRGPRPEITSAPAAVRHGETFTVATPTPDAIARASLIRLSSTTHAFNAGQRINWLTTTATADGVDLEAPADANVCPPGHYMLFLLTGDGVPSVAAILQVTAPPAPAADLASTRAISRAGAGEEDASARRAAVLESARGTEVTVGISGTCPYGLGACWGGAYEALAALEGVASVDPIPDTETSTARVFLLDDRLPALDRWEDQFAGVVRGSYVLRGVEVTLEGTVVVREGRASLDAGGDPRPAVELTALGPQDKVQWDREAAIPAAPTHEEASAHDRLATDPGARVRITGPLRWIGDRYELAVRSVHPL